MTVAHEIVYRAIALAEKSRIDPAVAATCLEEAAATVSETLSEKRAQAEPPVRALGAYLFRTFLHLIYRERRKGLLLEQALAETATIPAADMSAANVEMTLLLSKVMASCDKVTREIILRHLEGFSWQEIGERTGLSSHAAETRFGRVVEHARKTLNIPRQRG